MFDTIGSRIVISAEDLLWPDLSLRDDYPTLNPAESISEKGYIGKRFLCSGGIIGYAPEIWKLINYKENLKNDDDDQLYYTKAYLNWEIRSTLGHRFLDRLLRLTSVELKKTESRCHQQNITNTTFQKNLSFTHQIRSLRSIIPEPKWR